MPSCLLPGLQELAALEREFENRRVELEEEIDSLNKKVCGHIGMDSIKWNFKKYSWNRFFRYQASYRLSLATIGQ